MSDNYPLEPHWNSWWTKAGADELRAALLAWDPLGVTDRREDWPYVVTEYDAYRRPILERLIAGERETEIAAYLDEIVQSKMGLAKSPSVSAEAAALIVLWYERRFPHGG